MSGEEVTVDETSAVGPEEALVAGETAAPVAVIDDVLSPAEFIEMYHPDNPSGPNGEPEYSTTSRSAFDQIWRDKGWLLRPDPYARPEGEQDQPQDVAALEAAHPDNGEPQPLEVEAPNDKE